MEEINLLLEMAAEGDADELTVEGERIYSAIEHEVDDLETRSMLSRPEDSKSAIFTINAGSGGTDAQDWAAMLSRMYTRFFTQKGFECNEVDFLAGDLVGIKSVTFEVRGDYAYGFLKSEIGVHRLIRLSPFDTQHKRHTSFASVFVIPEAEDLEVDLDMKDVRVDTFRASGAGGQHVNKTDSAVRLTHIPTGIVVQSQAQRSQNSNKEFATKVLKARLFQKKMDDEKAKLAQIEQSKMDISFGSQIRTYTFHPYTLVKDHRTSEESGNLNAVMDGDLEKFVRSYLLKTSGINDKSNLE